MCEWWEDDNEQDMTLDTDTHLEERGEVQKDRAWPRGRAQGGGKTAWDWVLEWLSKEGTFWDQNIRESSLGGAEIKWRGRNSGWSSCWPLGIEWSVEELTLEQIPGDKGRWPGALWWCCGWGEMDGFQRRFVNGNGRSCWWTGCRGWCQRGKGGIKDDA